MVIEMHGISCNAKKLIYQAIQWSQFRKPIIFINSWKKKLGNYSEVLQRNNIVSVQNWIKLLID